MPGSTERRVLVVAAHPDDEVLGCGGAIARHASDGDAVHIVILGEGLTSRDDTRTEARHRGALRKLHGQAARAGRLLGAVNVVVESLPDNRFDSLDRLDVIKRVETHKARVRPHVVYTHHAGDMNVDHQVTHQAVLTAFRPLPGEILEELYAFETLSSTEWQAPDWSPPFSPDHWVDITAQLTRKCRALECYASELRPFPHPRSTDGVRTLARAAGMQVGVQAAERFRTLRRIRRVSR